MNTAQPKPRAWRSRQHDGIVLIDCLIYIAVFFVIVNLAFAALYRTWDAHRALNRSADDIVAALRAGERWRADIRAATGTIVQQAGAAEDVLTIPQASGTVTYHWRGQQLLRSGADGKRSDVLLQRVQSSRMQADPRGNGVPWRWELELKTSHAKARLHPLFTFLAVPPAAKP